MAWPLTKFLKKFRRSKLTLRNNRSVIALNLLHRYSNHKIRSAASFPELEKTIQREKAKAQPTAGSNLRNTYKSIWHFAKHMEENPEDLTMTGEDGAKIALKGELIKSSSKTYHYVMYDPELAEKFTTNETYWDGTFDSRPRIKQVGQFFTVMGMRAGVVSFTSVTFFWLCKKNWWITATEYFDSFNSLFLQNFHFIKTRLEKQHPMQIVKYIFWMIHLLGKLKI